MTLADLPGELPDQPVVEAAPHGPEPDFEVLGARPLRHAAVPTLLLDLQIAEPGGRQVYMIALKVQVMLEPARRAYDDETRSRLVGLFGPPERWAMTTRSIVWASLDVVVPAFTGTTTLALPIACSYDLEVAAAKYLHALTGGSAPLALHFNGIVYYRNDEGALQMVLIPWSRSIGFQLPVTTWTETVEHYYPNTGWIALRTQTIRALERARVQGAHATMDACVADLLAGTMADHLKELLQSLLWEGYALYPYTPGATKNATPTPFGILYPPAYARTLSSTFDHLELRCILRAPRHAAVHAEVSFLVASGAGHRATAQRLMLPPVEAGALAHAPARLTLPVAAAEEPLLVGVRLLSQARGDGAWEVVLRVANLTPCAAGLNRADALQRSLISTHPLLRTEEGCFVSPLERPCGSVNTFPVLATDADDAVLGAAIMLPDHPRVAPESRGGLFDSTEIEEALLLHVRTLSDGERAQIAEHDPAVAQMVARAAAATPQEIVRLHGRVTLSDPPEGRETDPPRGRETTEPPRVPAALADPTRGDERADVAGVTFRRGEHVLIRPGPEADLHARLLDGRTATIERIFTDYDGRTHLGVTIDGDPGQELMRETSRFLFFFANEVQVMST